MVTRLFHKQTKNMKELTRKNSWQALKSAAVVACIATGIMPIQAQTQISEIYKWEALPKEYSATGYAQLVVVEEEEEENDDRSLHVRIYDHNIELKKDLNISLGNRKGKTVIEERVSVDGEYTNEWKVTDEQIEESTDLAYCYYVNYDILAADPRYTDGGWTQTLFNTDDKYEYLAGVYEYGEPRTYTEDAFVNGEYIPIKRRTEYNSSLTATNVISESGEVLYTFPGRVNQFLLVGGKTYVITEEELGYGELSNFTFYEINRETNSIKAVQTSDIKMYPRLAHRSDNITIETGEAEAGQRKEVVITSMDGRLVGHHDIPAGQTSTQISVARLSGGVYNFTVYANGKRVDNGKIVIRQ